MVAKNQSTGRNEDMGRVVTTVKVENVVDLFNAQQGAIPSDQIRQITVADALVDTGATSFGLPSALIRQLGLVKVAEKRATTSAGPLTFSVYGPVRITIQDRFMTTDVLEVADGTPTIVGQIPLEGLDFVIDLQGRRLIGNPAHGGEHMLEMFGCETT
jgi:predicted aspartyl protease